MRSKIKKCSLFFDKSLQTWLDGRPTSEVRKALGVQNALEYAKSFAWMCLTGTWLGTEQDIPTLHPALQNYKLFLFGWSESDMILEWIAAGTRVEIVIGLNTTRTVKLKATFFEKGRTILGSSGTVFDIATGSHEGSFRSIPAVRALP